MKVKFHTKRHWANSCHQAGAFSYSPTYSPARSFKSSDQFSYTISDGKSSASATVSIGLSSTTTSKGIHGN